ncbi:Mu transposase C-terminal domain-containing protein [Streptomyces sp. NPDC001185]|uniref:Mu transposase C-terminal domain-containing protein n=1 Tax=Streptomyces sp. NPDC001185 TaxID=3154380 RepID=UPI003322E035
MRFEGRAWVVAGVLAGQVRLVAEDGEMAAVLLSFLFAAEDFAVLGAAVPRRVGARSLLDGLPARVRERALAWERHVREVETGSADGAGAGVVRAGYDLEAFTLGQREEAKAAELTAAGMPTSAVTVRRMRARYRENGVWGLVDGRVTRTRSALGQADERVLAAITAVLEEQRERSDGTLGRLRVYAERLLAERHGPGVVELPSPAVFARLVRALDEGEKVLDGARQRRWRSARPAPPFTTVVSLAPGELVMLDSTVLDVMAVLDDGLTERCELTIALDVATRSICACVVRPRGTRAVDAAVLLAQMMVPAPMRPGWPEALAMQQSAIPYQRLLDIDRRLEGAAARPVICPQTVVVDHGKVFVSDAFTAACAVLGVSLQPAPPGNPSAKGHVERTFSSVNTLFAQYVAGYTGSDVTRRGVAVEDEAVWSIAQLRELFEEWVISGWQSRPHEGLRHPLMPRQALSPNEMWAALIAVSGHVPVPLGREDYIELMPSRRQKINDYGIRIGYRTYDDAALNPYRGRTSNAPDGLWEIHADPHSPERVWVRLPEGWADVPWIHRTLISSPFTDFTWQHVKQTVAQRGSRAVHEHDIALALRELLLRAGAGTGSRRERKVAARARAQAATGHGPAQASGTRGDGRAGLLRGQEAGKRTDEAEECGRPDAGDAGERAKEADVQDRPGAGDGAGGNAAGRRSRRRQRTLGASAPAQRGPGEDARAPEKGPGTSGRGPDLGEAASGEKSAPHEPPADTGDTRPAPPDPCGTGPAGKKPAVTVYDPLQEASQW